MLKKVIAVVAMMLFAGVASAEMIGMYADMDATICQGPIAPGAPTSYYVIATLTQLADVGITAAEFKIDNLPISDYAAGGFVTPEWTSAVTVGDPWTDFSIAWSTPQGAGTGLVHIGTLSFLCFNPAWVGADHMMEFVEGDTCQCLVVVDEAFVSVTAIGGKFWANCTDPAQCQCIEEPTATQDTSWGSVKALF